MKGNWPAGRYTSGAASTMGSLLRQYSDIPAGLLEAGPEALADLLGGPSLVHLPGRREQPLFASVLLHGNETTGFLALQELLRKYRDKTLPRALSFLSAMSMRPGTACGVLPGSRTITVSGPAVSMTIARKSA